MAWFVVEQCLHFHSMVQDYCKAYTAPPKVRVTLGQANAMALVANRIRCPVSLEEFVKANYCLHIQGSEEKGTVSDEFTTEHGLWRRVLDVTSGAFDRWLRRRKAHKS